MIPAALGLQEAARYIGVSAGWLKTAPLPRVDLRRPGAPRAVWRWRVVDLDKYLADHVVPPGHG